MPGHSKISVTLDTYSPTLPSLHSEAADSINDFVAESKTKSLAETNSTVKKATEAKSGDLLEDTASLKAGKVNIFKVSTKTIPSGATSQSPATSDLN